MRSRQFETQCSWGFLLHDQDVVLLGHEVLYFVWDQRINEVEAEDGDICIPIGVCGAKAPKRTQENSIGAALGDDAERAAFALEQLVYLMISGKLLRRWQSLFEFGFLMLYRSPAAEQFYRRRKSGPALDCWR